MIQRRHAILKKKNKILITIPIEIQVPITRVKSEKITGVDWGIRTDISAGILNYDDLEFEKDLQLNETEAWKRSIESRKNTARLQRVKSSLERNSLKTGRFFKPLSAHLTFHGNKNRARLKNLAHGISSVLVQWSILNDSNIIALESLKSLKLERGALPRLLNYKINNSPRGILRELIEMKLRRYSGKLYSINAQFTSQYSSVLILNYLKKNKNGDKWYGNTTKGYRINSLASLPPLNERGGEFFYHELAPIINADINAAQNIALKLYHNFT